MSDAIYSVAEGVGKLLGNWAFGKTPQDEWREAGLRMRRENQSLESFTAMPSVKGIWEGLSQEGKMAVIEEFRNQGENRNAATALGAVLSKADEKMFAQSETGPRIKSFSDMLLNSGPSLAGLLGLTTDLMGSTWLGSIDKLAASRLQILTVNNPELSAQDRANLLLLSPDQLSKIDLTKVRDVYAGFANGKMLVMVDMLGSGIKDPKFAKFVDNVGLQNDMLRVIFDLDTGKMGLDVTRVFANITKENVGKFTKALQSAFVDVMGNKEAWAKIEGVVNALKNDLVGAEVTKFVIWEDSVNVEFSQSFDALNNASIKTLAGGLGYGSGDRVDFRISEQGAFVVGKTQSFKEVTGMDALKDSTQKMAANGQAMVAAFATAFTGVKGSMELQWALALGANGESVYQVQGGEQLAISGASLGMLTDAAAGGLGAMRSIDGGGIKVSTTLGLDDNGQAQTVGAVQMTLTQEQSQELNAKIKNKELDETKLPKKLVDLLDNLIKQDLLNKAENLNLRSEQSANGSNISLTMTVKAGSLSSKQLDQMKALGIKEDNGSYTFAARVNKSGVGTEMLPVLTANELSTIGRIVDLTIDNRQFKVRVAEGRVPGELVVLSVISGQLGSSDYVKGGENVKVLPAMLFQGKDGKVHVMVVRVEGASYQIGEDASVRYSGAVAYNVWSGTVLALDESAVRVREIRSDSGSVISVTEGAVRDRGGNIGWGAVTKFTQNNQTVSPKDIDWKGYTLNINGKEITVVSSTKTDAGWELVVESVKLGGFDVTGLRLDGGMKIVGMQVSGEQTIALARGVTISAGKLSNAWITTNDLGQPMGGTEGRINVSEYNAGVPQGGYKFAEGEGFPKEIAFGLREGKLVFGQSVVLMSPEGQFETLLHGFVGGITNTTYEATMEMSPGGLVPTGMMTVNRLQVPVSRGGSDGKLPVQAEDSHLVVNSDGSVSGIVYASAGQKIFSAGTLTFETAGTSFQGLKALDAGASILRKADGKILADVGRVEQRVNDLTIIYSKSDGVQLQTLNGFTKTDDQTISYTNMVLAWSAAKNEFQEVAGMKNILFHRDSDLGFVAGDKLTIVKGRNSLEALNNGALVEAFGAMADYRTAVVDVLSGNNTRDWQVTIEQSARTKNMPMVSLSAEMIDANGVSQKVVGGVSKLMGKDQVFASLFEVNTGRLVAGALVGSELIMGQQGANRVLARVMNGQLVDTATTRTAVAIHADKASVQMGKVSEGVRTAEMEKIEGMTHNVTSIKDLTENQKTLAAALGIGLGGGEAALLYQTGGKQPVLYVARGGNGAVAGVFDIRTKEYLDVDNGVAAGVVGTLTAAARSGRESVGYVLLASGVKAAPEWLGSLMRVTGARFAATATVTIDDGFVKGPAGSHVFVQTDKGMLELTAGKNGIYQKVLASGVDMIKGKLTFVTSTVVLKADNLETSVSYKEAKVGMAFNIGTGKGVVAMVDGQLTLKYTHIRVAGNLLTVTDQKNVSGHSITVAGGKAFELTNQGWKNVSVINVKSQYTMDNKPLQTVVRLSVADGKLSAVAEGFSVPRGAKGQVFVATHSSGYKVNIGQDANGRWDVIGLAQQTNTPVKFAGVTGNMTVDSKGNITLTGFLKGPEIIDGQFKLKLEVLGAQWDKNTKQVMVATYAKVNDAGYVVESVIKGAGGGSGGATKETVGYDLIQVSPPDSKGNVTGKFRSTRADAGMTLTVPLKEEAKFDEKEMQWTALTAGSKINILASAGVVPFGNHTFSNVTLEIGKGGDFKVTSLGGGASFDSKSLPQGVGVDVGVNGNVSAFTSAANGNKAGLAQFVNNFLQGFEKASTEKRGWFSWFGAGKDAFEAAGTKFDEVRTRVAGSGLVSNLGAADKVFVGLSTGQIGFLTTDGTRVEFASRAENLTARITTKEGGDWRYESTEGILSKAGNLVGIGTAVAKVFSLKTGEEIEIVNAAGGGFGKNVVTGKTARENTERYLASGAQYHTDQLALSEDGNMVLNTEIKSANGSTETLRAHISFQGDKVNVLSHQYNEQGTLVRFVDTNQKIESSFDGKTLSFRIDGRSAGTLTAEVYRSGLELAVLSA
jgi:hypothetical protein